MERSEMSVAQTSSDPSFQRLLDCLILVDRLYQRFESSGTLCPIEVYRLDIRLAHWAAYWPTCPPCDRQMLLSRVASLTRCLRPDQE